TNIDKCLREPRRIDRCVTNKDLQAEGGTDSDFGGLAIIRQNIPIGVGNDKLECRLEIFRSGFSLKTQRVERRQKVERIEDAIVVHVQIDRMLPLKRS